MHPHHAPTLAGKAHNHWVVNNGVADGARTSIRVVRRGIQGHASR